MALTKEDVVSALSARVAPKTRDTVASGGLDQVSHERRKNLNLA